jgi:hypothetical protein
VQETNVARWHRLGSRCFLTSSATPLRAAFSQWRKDLIPGFLPIAPQVVWVDFLEPDNRCPSWGRAGAQSRKEFIGVNA